MTNGGCEIGEDRVYGRLGVNGKKDRWCILRKSSFVFFKSKASHPSLSVLPESAVPTATWQDDTDPIGAISLDALCTVVPPAKQQQAVSVRRATISVS